MNQLTKVAVVVFDGISAFHLSIPTLAFQDIFVDTPPQFELTLCSIDGRHIRSSSGFDMQIEADLTPLQSADIVIVPSWPNELPPVPNKLVQALLDAHQRGALLVGLCLGAFVIADTGLLDGKRATTHWGLAQQFQQRYPKVELDSLPLFIEYPQIITSAGVAAALDCCLQVIRRYCGSDVANQLARMMVTAPYRSGGQQQYIPRPVPNRPEHDNGLVKVIEQINQQLEQPYNLEQVAARCAMSKRSFTRQFKASYGTTFGQWLLDQRLNHSQQLLEQTTTSISDVAQQCGFNDDSVFRKQFKAAYQVSPSQWRQQFGHYAQNNRSNVVDE